MHNLMLATTERHDMSDLIDTSEIARMLGLTRSYITDKVTKRDDFPKPKIAISQKTVRWARDEVERWAAPSHPA